MAITAKLPDFNNLDNERILAFVNGRLPGIVALVLVVLIGWQLAQLVWMLVPGSATGDPVTAPPAALSSAQGAGAATATDAEVIAASHLFGEASAEPVVVEGPKQITEDLEETTLALTLKGTMAGTDNRLTIAIIADNRNEEKIYSIGDAVTAGTTLEAVYADQVVLNRNGILESLKLPKDLPTSSAPPVRRQTTASRTAAPTQSASIQNVLTQNATKLADVIRPTPYFVAGQQQGYRVYPGRNRKQFAALGLRPGDLIKDIDGASLTDPQQAMQIFQNLGSADQVSVTVERNGQPEVIVLSTSQLNLDNDQ